FRTPLVWTLTWLFLNLSHFVSAQQSNGSADPVQPGAILSKGVELARKKGLEKAYRTFQEAEDYWQVNAASLLYLHIIADVNNKVLKKKVATEIFKALYEASDAKPKKGLKRIDKLLKKNKHYFPLYLVKGDILTNLDQTEEAESVFAAAIEEAPDAPLPHLLRGRFHAKLGANQQAIDDFSQAVAMDSSLAIGFFERGFLLCVEKKYDDAIRDFEIASKSYPDWGQSAIVNEAFFGRGVGRIQRKLYRKALADFDRAIAINPNYVRSYFNRGLAYKGLKSYAKAIEDFDACIAHNDQFKDAYYQRASTNLDRGRTSKAVPDLVKVLELDPRDKKSYLKLAESYYKLRKYNAAIQQLDKLIELDATYFWAYYRKGYACKDSGKRRQAIAAFQKFLSVVPKKYYKQIAHAEVEIKKLKSGMR
ncbi:MAG: tetratricopeptide repeat protein, partial [bacterium]